MKVQPFNRVSAIELYVLYEHPRDAPGQWVMRRWTIRQGAVQPVAGYALMAADPEPLRRLMRDEGRVVMPRFDGDDPCIVEVWL